MLLFCFILLALTIRYALAMKKLNQSVQTSEKNVDSGFETQNEAVDSSLSRKLNLPEKCEYCETEVKEDTRICSNCGKYIIEKYDFYIKE